MQEIDKHPMQNKDCYPPLPEEAVFLKSPVRRLVGVAISAAGRAWGWTLEIDAASARGNEKESMLV
jgi:hypothetical protein